MPVLSQTFFPFVGCHFMSLSLFTAWHNYWILELFNFRFDGVGERFGRFESGNVMGGDDQRRVLGDVSASLLGTLFNYETAETPQIDVIFLQ